ncbi:hypothetical protein F5X68DRAFT_223548 [Plectosphaerella plurivora]|uniref:Nephrocystin 3-like N-terminal domain-containing protein n=1 Tax=Plectosphaerella plurivora TaxID=936078 RepID=A0A9P9A8G1_9PEZI|nr:hypothetical protein F5X68DRAFT_223548 [Plectosphaerella plurivora]
MIALLIAGVYGLTLVAITASYLLASLPSIRIGLMVDIRLGDVVASYAHVPALDCRSYDIVGEVPRDDRDTTDPEIFYGIIVSGNTLIKDVVERDRIVKTVGEDCLYFEIEAAGLMDYFPCLMIRGICDYADAYKNDRWPRYVSVTTAAYAKELLVLHDDKLERWLRPPNPSINANHARKLRYEGTGAWLLAYTIFHKTVLSTTTRDRLLLSFFFDFSDATKQTVDGILRSLTFQLYSTTATSIIHLDVLYAAYRDGYNQPTTETLLDAVYKILVSYKEVAIILDALDESTTRGDLLICTSRPEDEFQRNIKENYLKFDKQAQRRDFQDKHLSQGLLKRIQRKHEKALVSLPRNLDETYFRMLTSILADLKDDRPLRLAEAIEVIATQIEEDFARFNVESRLFRLVSVLHLSYFSVKEYLLGIDQIKLPTTSISITITCLTYLTDIEGSHTEIKRQFPMGSRLYYACLAGLSGAAKAILDEGADVNAKGGYIETVKLLLEKGASVNAEGGEYGNALYTALSKGHTEIAKLLLEKGAKVNAKGGRYGNALQAALYRGYADIIRIL